jgi:predicted transcriptional regulator
VARLNGQPIHLAQIVPIAKAALERLPLNERDGQRPLMLRQALSQYIERELLFQEAVARGIEADARAVGWAYDQARREHRDEKDWEDFLAQRGMDPRSFRTELRVQKTVDALLDEEVRRFEVPEAWSRHAYDADPAAFAEPGDKAAPSFEKARGRVEEAVRAQKRATILGDLLTRLRARAQIETFL